MPRLTPEQQESFHRQQAAADEQLRALLALPKSHPARFLFLYGRSPSELSRPLPPEDAEALLTEFFEAAKMDPSTAKEAK